MSNPKLVLIVGCFGLLSNILGLFLFHEHGHGHGHNHDHGHGHSDQVHTAEEGRSHRIEIADESGPIENVLPENVVTAGMARPQPKELSKVNEDGLTAVSSKGGKATSPVSVRRPMQNGKSHHRQSSSSRRQYASAEDINVHPASFRFEIIRAASRQGDTDGDETESEREEAIEEEDEEEAGGATEQSALLPKRSHSTHDLPNGHHRPVAHDSWHATHKHSSNNDPKSGGHGGSGGHSHGDLNMRGVFLHVMGDALGNIGVIASALFIWLTPFWWRFYSDPVISLLITVIILASAIPLCKAASRILLQGVPVGMRVDEIRADIEGLPGIIGCHHLHVWQLSDTKFVASLHVQVDYDFKGEGSSRYMQLARAVRKCLHAYGIHSSTIQPEFCLDPARSPTSAHFDQQHQQEHPNDDDNKHEDDHNDQDMSRRKGGSTPRRGGGSGSGIGSAEGGGGGGGGSHGNSRRPSRAGSVKSGSAVCLLECGDECDEQGQCCVPRVEINGTNGTADRTGPGQS